MKSFYILSNHRGTEHWFPVNHRKITTYHYGRDSVIHLKVKRVL